MFQYPIILAIFLVLGAAIGYFARHFIGIRAASSVEQKIKKQIDESRSRAKELILEAQEKSTSLLEEVKKEEREIKTQITRLEERMIKKEELAEKQLSDLRNKENQLNQEIEKTKQSQQENEELRKKSVKELERVADMNVDEAKKALFEDIKLMYQKDLVISVQKLERERKEELEKKSVEIMASAMQRLSRVHVSEATTSAFNISDENLKGKIIGREGRNIRALEKATGAEFIIDENPDTIIISSFDPIRREIAKMALEKLIKDGRIQPAKIEEKVEESKNELSKRIIEIGENAVRELGIYDFPKEIIQLLGRLNFRYSYGQSVLDNSVEASYLAGMLASELGLNVDTAKKGALVHDIGKAIDHEVEGTHVELGRKILKKYGVAEEVIRAMESHHEEYPFSTSESYIVAAADSLSAGRPGARRDNLENYIKKLEDLEKIAVSFEGVKNAYAISAGRELRVFVTPEKIDDFGALQLARNIALKIESEIKYPGEIKVNVIREVRAVEYAR